MMHTCEQDCDRVCLKKDVRVIYIDKKHEAKHIMGTFVDKSHYDLLIQEDTDVYGPSIDGSMTEDNIILKFRKNVFTKEEQDLAYEGLIGAASESQNRGMAAGPRGQILSSKQRGGREWVTPYQMDVLDYLSRTHNDFLETETLEDIKKRHEGKAAPDETRGYVWMRSEVQKDHDPYYGWFDRWVDGLGNYDRDQQRESAEYVKENYISVTNYAQTVMSGVAGYYSRYPRIPYGRATSYTEKHLDKFEKCYPFLRKLNHCFRELLPNRWAAQRYAADQLDPRFCIDETVFTTLTVNHNFRTAAHLDAGDLSTGFSNLSAVGKGWEDAELVLPEYRAAVDLKQGDLLLVANHTAIHGNVEIGGENPDRMSIVAYFREDMLECKSWEYEALRKQFIDERRQNKDHPLQRKLWNGVSPAWDYSQEWYDYLKAHGMKDPYGNDKIATLESFFE
jgi:hypothetical protein